MKKTSFLPLFYFVSFTAFAGQFLTDEPEPTDLHSTAYEISGTWAHSHNSPDEKAASIEIKYGLLPETEVFVAFGYEHVSNDEDIAALHGIGDAELGVKYQFFKAVEGLPSLAIAPTIGLPTGNNDMSNRKAWYELPLWIEKEWDEWSTSGGLGVVFNSADEAKDFFFAGWKVQHDFSDKLNLGLELFYQGRDSEDNRDLTLLNVGGAYKLCRNLNLDFSVGHSIYGQNQTIGYLGVSFVI
jgi:hypothetical protein